MRKIVLLALLCATVHLQAQAQDSFELWYTFGGFSCNAAAVTDNDNGVTGSAFVRVGMDCNDYEDDVFGWRTPSTVLWDHDKYVRVRINAPAGKVMNFSRPQAMFLLSSYSSFSGSSFFELAMFVNGTDSVYIGRVTPDSDINVTRFVPNIPNAKSIEMRIYPWLSAVDYQGWDGIKAFRFSGRLVNENLTSNIDDMPDIPLKASLRPAYPNPFNPTTTIPFDVSEVSRITLEVYDAMGRKVSTLASERTYQLGRHSLIFDAGGISSGTYLYRLVVDGHFVEASTFTLIK